MSDSRTQTLQLIGRAFGYLKGLGDRRLAAFIAGWPSELLPFRRLPARSLPVLAYLPEAIRAAAEPTEGLVELIKLSAPHLRWDQTYSQADVGAAFLKKYGWTELIGRRGPVAGSDMAVGILLLGPGVEYPSHRHGAEEIYAPLTGPALWWRGDGQWVRRPGGGTIYHRPWQPHAARTESVPLLALYLWRGRDLARKSELV